MDNPFLGLSWWRQAAVLGLDEPSILALLDFQRQYVDETGRWPTAHEVLRAFQQVRDAAAKASPDRRYLPSSGL